MDNKAVFSARLIAMMACAALMLFASYWTAQSLRVLHDSVGQVSTTLADSSTLAGVRDYFARPSHTE